MLRLRLTAARPVCVALLTSVVVAACGGGGSVGLNDYPTTVNSLPTTVTANFNTNVKASYFVSGTPPFHARFSNGIAAGNGAWVIKPGTTGVINFGTPADEVLFTARQHYTAAPRANAMAAKQPQALPAPFAGVDMYVRGTELGWNTSPAQLLVNTSGNILQVTLPLTTASVGGVGTATGVGDFKIADGGWTAATNCGANTTPTPIVIGTPFTMQCAALSQNIQLTIPANGNYTFTVDVSNATAPTVTVTAPSSSGGGGGPTQTPASSEYRFYDGTGTLIKSIKGDASTAVDQLQRGGDPRIASVQIENKIGDAGDTIGDLGITGVTWKASSSFSPAPTPIDLYYRRATGGYTGTTISVGGVSYPCVVTTSSSFGCVAQGVPVLPYADYTMTVSNSDDTTDTITFNAGDGSQPVYGFSGAGLATAGTPGDPNKPLAAIPQNANEVILFYKRPDNNYTGWGLHLFPVSPPTGDWTVWTGPFGYEGIDPNYGAYFRITLPPNAGYSANPAALTQFPDDLGFIIHKGDTKDPGPDQHLRIAETGNMVFVVSGGTDISAVPPVPGAVRLVGAAAHWITSDTILWTPTSSAVTTVSLLYSPDASITSGATGLVGTSTAVPLDAGTNKAGDNALDLKSLSAWSLPAAAVANAAAIARTQMVVVGYAADGSAVEATSVQIAGALDDLYAAAAATQTLGVSYSGNVPTLAVWAPTALTNPGVSVNVYDAGGTLIQNAPMTLDPATGIWSVAGTASWDRKYYRIALQAYSYASGSIVTNEVTDPYSVNLATDSAYSQFVNLDDSDLKPAGWDTLAKPVISTPEDIVLYELQVRDFSINDPQVPAADRGRYTAFDQPAASTNGRRQLEALAAAGVTHVHILPAFDIATVEEDRSKRVELDDTVDKLCAANSAAAGLCPANNALTIRQLLANTLAGRGRNTPDVQQITTWLAGIDGFNWGYDPWHYGAPEGSYATDANVGTALRVLDFRRMVKGLSTAGLATVMDVVYNHSNSSGQNSTSVLDKVVPGYYHRRDRKTGAVTTDSCCADTAPENAMMEKLVTDTLVRWARDYKIDGFRFDIMGFHPKSGIVNAFNATKAINPHMYFYGEGWNFGTVQNDTRFVQATQKNLAGTGIGTFNDRMRDAVRGGGPFDGGASYVANQGFVSGQYYDPNVSNSGSTAERDALLHGEDLIRVVLAGGLKNFRFEDHTGTVVNGSQVDYSGQPAGYTSDPSETINYVEAHDNETFWDISQYKQPTGTSTADRVRAHNVATSLVLLGQGVPFLHAGQEVLRSKSMDKNSYNSGDWFNALDYSLQSSNWAVGLPQAQDNQGNWPTMAPVVDDASTNQMQADRAAALAVTEDWLKIRKDTTLFRLPSGDQVQKRVSYLNTGPGQAPGVIVQQVDGCTDPTVPGTKYSGVVVVYNATKTRQVLPLLLGLAYTLHPVLAASPDAVVHGAAYDPVTGFSVPARTTAVFVSGAAAKSCAPYPVSMYVRGIGGDWSATAGDMLQFQGGTQYTLTLAAPAGAQQFKIADFNWADATNCGGTAANQSMTLGVPRVIACGANTPNLGLNAPVAGNYVFSLDATSTAAPVLTVSLAPPFGATTLFVRGGFNDWGNGPSPTAPMSFDGAGKYQAVIAALAAGTYGFKVADANWTGPTNCGAGANGNLTLGTPFALVCNNSSGNINATFPATGTYLFSADFSNVAAPLLTVEQAPFAAALFVRGSFNDWGNGPSPTTPLAYIGGGKYSAYARLAPASAQFKIADANWTDGTNCGAAGPLVAGTPLTLACSGNTPNIPFTVSADGYYQFSLDATLPAAPALTVTAP